MGYNGRRGESERFENGGLGVGHVRSILEDDRAVTSGDPEDLFLDVAHDVLVGTQLADGPHQQVADGRVAAEKVLEFVEDVIPVEFVTGCAPVGVGGGGVDVTEQGVGEIARIVAVERVPVLFDDVRQDEAADVGAPADELLHVAPVDGQQPRQEVDGVALVDVPEDLVEEAHRFLETGVRVGEP